MNKQEKIDRINSIELNIRYTIGLVKALLEDLLPNTDEALMLSAVMRLQDSSWNYVSKMLEKAKQSEDEE